MVLNLGGGRISRAIAAARKLDGARTTILPIRSGELRRAIGNSSFRWNDYSQINYLAYDRYMTVGNVAIFRAVLNELNREGYRGTFVYYNTQDVLRNILTPQTHAFWRFDLDRYGLIKRAQSKLLKVAEFRCLELYLPVVVDLKSERDLLFARIAESIGLQVPNAGKNRMYILRISDLTLFLESVLKRSIGPGRHFLWSSYETLESLVGGGNAQGGSAGQYRATNGPFNLTRPAAAGLKLAKVGKSCMSTLYVTLFGGRQAPATQVTAMEPKNVVEPVKFLTRDEHFSLHFDYLPPEDIKWGDIVPRIVSQPGNWQTANNLNPPKI